MYHVPRPVTRGSVLRAVIEPVGEAGGPVEKRGGRQAGLRVDAPKAFGGVHSFGDTQRLLASRAGAGTKQTANPFRHVGIPGVQAQAMNLTREGRQLTFAAGANVCLGEVGTRLPFPHGAERAEVFVVVTPNQDEHVFPAVGALAAKAAAVKCPP